MKRIEIAPSILTADFLKLGEQISEVIKSGVRYLHIDVMDGHFVPNLTFGPLMVSSLKGLTTASGVLLDVHLMVEKPESMLRDFAKAGADIITVHVETCPHLHRTIQQIHDLGCKAGVAINPATPVVFYENILSEIEIALIMSVNPGFGGQTFIEESLDKINKLREMIYRSGNERTLIEVDGGVKALNARKIVDAGADILVVGSAIFNDNASIRENVNQILAELV